MTLDCSTVCEQLSVFTGGDSVQGVTLEHGREHYDTFSPGLRHQRPPGGEARDAAEAPFGRQQQPDRHVPRSRRTNDAPQHHQVKDAVAAVNEAVQGRTTLGQRVQPGRPEGHERCKIHGVPVFFRIQRVPKDYQDHSSTADEVFETDVLVDQQLRVVAPLRR